METQLIRKHFIYIKAEKYLQEFKFLEAVEMLSLTREKYQNASIVPIVMLRECLLRMIIDDTSMSLDIAKSLQNTSLAPEGITAWERYMSDYIPTHQKLWRFIICF